MKAFAVLIALLSWACLFLLPRNTGSRVLQCIVFGLLGTLFALAGGFQYWWDSGMQPSKKSAVILVCGLVTLLSQAGTILHGVLAQEGGIEWERPDRKRR